MTSTTTRDDRVFPLTRWVAAFIVLFLVPGFVILYLMPYATDLLWAWEIKPPMTPVVMGAGYLAGAYFFTNVFRAKRWHTVAAGFPMITVFTWGMGLATAFHLARFHLTPGSLGNVAFWVWAGLYAVTPFVVPALWLWNRTTDPITPEPNAVLVPRAVRWTMALAGVVELGLAVFLWVLPEQAKLLWPWAITPLTARVLGGWLGMAGTGRLAIAADARWTAWRVVVQTAALWQGLILLSVGRFWSDFDPTRPFTWVYLGYTALSFIALCALVIKFDFWPPKK